MEQAGELRHLHLQQPQACPRQRWTREASCSMSLKYGQTFVTCAPRASQLALALARVGARFATISPPPLSLLHKPHPSRPHQLCRPLVRLASPNSNSSSRRDRLADCSAVDLGRPRTRQAVRCSATRNNRNSSSSSRVRTPAEGCLARRTRIPRRARREAGSLALRSQAAEACLGARRTTTNRVAEGCLAVPRNRARIPQRRRVGCLARHLQGKPVSGLFD